MDTSDRSSPPLASGDTAHLGALELILQQRYGLATVVLTLRLDDVEEDRPATESVKGPVEGVGVLPVLSCLIAVNLDSCGSAYVVIHGRCVYFHGDLYLGRVDQLPKVAARLAWLLGVPVVPSSLGSES